MTPGQKQSNAFFYGKMNSLISGNNRPIWFRVGNFPHLPALIPERGRVFFDKNQL